MALVVALAGCSDDGPPPPVVTTTVSAPSSSTAPSPSPSVSPSPTLPATAARATRPGAEAFARYFFEVYNYAFWTGNLDELRTISDSRCIYCASTIEAVETVKSEKATVEGGRIEIVTAVAGLGKPEDRVVVNLVLNEDKVRTLSSTGVTLDETPAVRRGRVDVAVRWIGDRWVLLDADVIKTGAS